MWDEGLYSSLVRTHQPKPGVMENEENVVRRIPLPKTLLLLQTCRPKTLYDGDDFVSARRV